MSKKIAIQGELGAYSHIAAESLYAGAEIKTCTTFEEAFKRAYNDQNYNFLGNSLNYSFSSTENDKPNQGYENSIITARVGTTFEQFKDVTAVLGLTASIDDLRTLDNASDSLKKQSGNFSEVAGNYGFTLDNRDRAFMPTSGSIVHFSQSLPFYADKSFLANRFSSSIYKQIGENVIGASKLYLSTINGLDNDDVRLSKRQVLSSRRMRGFEKGKIGPIDGSCLLYTSDAADE